MMSLNLLFPACALVCGAYFMLYVRRLAAVADQQRLQGMQDVVRLRRLLEALPQHRGMANALLQGDESFRNKVAELQAQIDRGIAGMVNMSSGGDRWGVATRVDHIQDTWSAIKRELDQLAAPESFARHTLLITELLYLINDVADAAGLLALSDNRAQLIDAAINALPLVTETLGQARGMGTGVAARGQCTTDMRVKLRYLLEHTRRVSDEVAQAVQAVLRDDAALKARAAKVLADSQLATQGFLSLLESRIIAARQVEIVPAEYYAAGTEAIQHSFELLDNIYTALTARLGAEVRQARKRVWLARVAAMVLLAPALYLSALLL